MPFELKDSVPLVVEQEPSRTSGAPLVSPLKVQPPKKTAQGAEETAGDTELRLSCMDFALRAQQGET